MRGKRRFLRGLSLTHRQIAWFCAAMLGLSLLPLYGISFYNHPYYDDFGFSILTHAAWRETGNVGRVIAAAWNNTASIRQTWQGMYTPSFLCALQPGIFGESGYWVSAFLLLSGLLASTGFFTWQILRKALGIVILQNTYSFFFNFFLYIAPTRHDYPPWVDIIL